MVRDIYIGDVVYYTRSLQMEIRQIVARENSTKSLMF